MGSHQGRRGPVEKGRRTPVEEGRKTRGGSKTRQTFPVAGRRGNETKVSEGWRGAEGCVWWSGCGVQPGI